jgi:hypothetical protein
MFGEPSGLIGQLGGHLMARINGYCVALASE